MRPNNSPQFLSKIKSSIPLKNSTILIMLLYILSWCNNTSNVNESDINVITSESKKLSMSYEDFESIDSLNAYVLWIVWSDVQDISVLNDEDRWKIVKNCITLFNAVPVINWDKTVSLVPFTVKEVSLSLWWTNHSYKVYITNYDK